MVKRISKIHNLGRFENFSGTHEFSSNTIIFGFNGARKSTLSDVFYSLSKENSDMYLTRRRTLNRDGEIGEKQIEIDILSDNGTSFEFVDGAWNNRPRNLFVFNEKYIDDHVFVSKQIEGDTVPIGIGTEGARLLRQRDELVQNNINILTEINSDMAALVSANIKIKDFLKLKLARKLLKKDLNGWQVFLYFH